MATVRLSKESREALAQKIVIDALGKEGEKIQKRRNDFSIKVYNDIYPAGVRKKMYDLPDGWLPESDSFTVQFGASSMGYCRRPLSEKKRFLAMHKLNHGQCIAVYDDNHALTKEHGDITKHVDEYNERKTKAYREALAIMNSCQTTKQLKELWPEITSYVEAYEPKEERTTAIVPMTTELNKILGLKVK